MGQGYKTVKPILNQLIQLQDLCYALNEREAATPKTRLVDLEASVERMISTLPPEIEIIVRDLLRRSSIFVCPLINHACSGCSQSLPTSLDFSARHSGDPVQCTSCGRYLFLPESGVRTGNRRLGRAGIGSGRLGQFSDSSLIIPQLNAKTSEEAIEELVDLMSEEGFISDPKDVLERTLSRETIASTAVERGLAFPHARGIEGGGLTLAMGMKKAGIEFNAPDKHLTRIIFFSVIPTAASAFYLKLISGLIQAFREAEHRRTLLACKDSELVWDTLVDLTRATVG